MATKPTERILDWASAGSTTDPGAAKEAAGWLTSERPPANWWNWILNSFGKWLTWSETSIDALDSRPKVHYAARMTVGSSPSVSTEGGDTVSSFGSTGVNIDVNLTTGVADYLNAAIHVTPNISATTLRATAAFTSNTQFNIGGHDISDGAVIDMNTGSRTVYVTIIDYD